MWNASNFAHSVFVKVHVSESDCITTLLWLKEKLQEAL